MTQSALDRVTTRSLRTVHRSKHGTHAAWVTGASIGGNPSKVGCAWAWCHVNRSGDCFFVGSGVTVPKDLGVLVVGEHVAELWAAVCALQGLPDNWSGKLYMKASSITCMRLTDPWNASMDGVPSFVVDKLRHHRQRIPDLGLVVYKAGAANRARYKNEHEDYVDGICTAVAKSAEAAAPQVMNRRVSRDAVSSRRPKAGRRRTGQGAVRTR